MRKEWAEPIRNMLGLKSNEEIPANLEAFIEDAQTLFDRQTQGVIRDRELTVLVAAYKLVAAATGARKKTD